MFIKLYRADCSILFHVFKIIFKNIKTFYYYFHNKCPPPSLFLPTLYFSPLILFSTFFWLQQFFIDNYFITSKQIPCIFYFFIILVKSVSLNLIIFYSCMLCNRLLTDILVLHSYRKS